MNDGTLTLVRELMDLKIERALTLVMAEVTKRDAVIERLAKQVAELELRLGPERQPGGALLVPER